MRTAWVHTTSRAVRILVRVAIGVLFVYSGWTKLRQPEPTAAFLESVLYTDLAWIVPVVAGAELSLGLWLLSGVRIDRAAKVAFAAFLGFGVLHGFAVAAPEPPPPCGCLGQAEIVESWPPWMWIIANAALAAIAGVLALAHPGRREHHEPQASEGLVNHAV